MSNPNIREKLHQYIDQAEEKKIEALYIMFEEDIVDLEAYNQDIEEAEKEIRTGKSHTHEEVQQLVKGWKKDVA